MSDFTKQIKNIAEVIKADKEAPSTLYVKFQHDIRRFFFTDGKQFYADAKLDNVLDEPTEWKNVHSIVKSEIVNVAKNLKAGASLEITEGDGFLSFNVTNKSGAKTTHKVISATKEPFPNFFDSPHCYSHIKIEGDKKAMLSATIKNMDSLMVKEYRGFAEYLHITCDEVKSIRIDQIDGRHLSFFRMPVEDCNMGGTNATLHLHKDHLQAIVKLLDVTSDKKHFELSWVPRKEEDENTGKPKYNIVEAMSWFEDNIIFLRWEMRTKDSIRVPDISQIGANQKCVGRFEMPKADLMSLIKNGIEGKKNPFMIISSETNEVEFITKDTNTTLIGNNSRVETLNGVENFAARIDATKLLKILKIAKGDTIAMNLLYATNKDELMTMQILEGGILDGEPGLNKEANHGYAWMVIFDNHAEF